ncbi:MAG TPA: aminotransferase class I/II-fold pyridoxal phosphate-dependent enzyme, partial [Casimicrobiaceae bacterium]|nr:aminotransferase class I/II-fold pyridoxal phosphate-dependent enzyme [Casimicrobiaceae bacterium]
MNRVRQPFNVSTLAQAAALAALDDGDFLRRSAEVNRRGMKQITDGLQQLGRACIPSFGNFVCFHAGAAAQVYQRLLEQGVIVRPVAGYGLPEFLRVTVGLPAENRRFLDAMAVALAR